MQSIKHSRRSVRYARRVPIYIGTDLTQPRAIEVALAEIIESVGPISVLVNNAGMQIPGLLKIFLSTNGIKS